MKNTIKYKGKHYSTRTFEAYLADESEDDAQTLVIASSLLSDAMDEKILNEGSIEEAIDKGIYYYVDAEHFNDDADVICLVYLDEPFTLVEEII